MKRRSYFSRILAPPADAVVLRAPRSPFSRPPEVPTARSPLFSPAPTLPTLPRAIEPTAAQPTAGKHVKVQEKLPPSISPARTPEVPAAPAAPLVQRHRGRTDAKEPRSDERPEGSFRAAKQNQVADPEPIPPIGPQAFETQPVERPSVDWQIPEPPRKGPPMEFRPSKARAPSVPTLPEADHESGSLAPSARLQGAPRDPERRVEIGSVEVRLVPQPPPAKKAARSKSSGPLLRSSGSLFGLRQI